MYDASNTNCGMYLNIFLIVFMNNIYTNYILAETLVYLKYNII